MSEDTNNKVCPLRLVGTGETTMWLLRCIQRRCAWYSEEEEKCVVLSTAEWIRRRQSNAQSILD